RWLRRRAESEPGKPARSQGYGAVRLVLPDSDLAEDARGRGRRREPGRRNRGERVRVRRLDPGPEHVPSRPRTGAGRELEGWVGGGAAISHAGLRPDPSP